MLVDFFFLLRAAGLRPSLTEFLHLLAVLRSGLSENSIDRFYVLSRASLIKDEALYDRFDRVFSAYFEGLESFYEALELSVPADWLERQSALHLSDEEKAEIESLGGWQEIMETLRKRFEEQEGRHAGGNRWIGTAGTSPYGAWGYNPEGVRIGQSESRHRRAVKVWDQREFRNLDAGERLDNRNMKLALRRLRRFAREGAATELDLDGTIKGTARNAGLLDIHMVPERHNAIKVLLLLDIGGSMDDHIRTCERLFSAARAEFKHLEHYYFHNFLYESVWRDNKRRHSQRIPTTEILRTYGPDYKVIIVGDATMSPYEILYPGGSVEHWNDEAGAVWMERLLSRWRKVAWLNPEPAGRWDYVPSVKITRELIEDRMYPLTLEGVDEAMRSLR